MSVSSHTDFAAGVDEVGRRVVVVGGGISGLASAAMLARLGHDVTLLERQERVGGRAGRWQPEGYRFDTGPSWYLMPEVFEHFFELMGTRVADHLDLTRLEPGYRVYVEGQREPIDVVSDRAAAMELFESLEPGAGARLGRYLDSAKDAYELALESFLYTSYASFLPVLSRRVVAGLPRLARLLTESLQHRAQRTVRDPRLRQILGYPAVFLASAPDKTPSLYHLLSHLDLTDGVYYPQGGFSTLIDAVERIALDAGVTIRTGADVEQICVSDGAEPRVTGVRYRASDGQGGALEQVVPADVVVSAADLHHTETQLLPRELQTYPQRWWDKRLPGPGAILMFLGVRGELPELAHHTLIFTRDWGANFSAIFDEPTRIPDPASVYVSRISATDDDAAPDGYENLFVLVPCPADPSIGRGGVDGAGEPGLEAAADAVIAQIADYIGVDDLAERIELRRVVGPGDFESDLNAWSGTSLGPAHTLRQSAFFRGGVVSRKVGGLYYCGSSTQPGVGLPMCLISAEIMVKAMYGDTSTAQLATPLGPESFAGGPSRAHGTVSSARKPRHAADTPVSAARGTDSPSPVLTLANSLLRRIGVSIEQTR